MIFTNPATNNQRFLLAHKNGYLIPLTKMARTYNSMAHGLSALVFIEPQLTPLKCQLLVESNQKILASSSSVLSVLDLDLKAVEG